MRIPTLAAGVMSLSIRSPTAAYHEVTNVPLIPMTMRRRQNQR